METYTPRRQNTVAQYIGIIPILDLCLEVDRRPGLQVPRRWWEQTGMDSTDWREAVGEYGEEREDGEGEWEDVGVGDKE